jgi:2-oxoglutarate dehydrogenase E1 component
MRRQALLLKTDPLPLIVMTPKSLLRHPLAASSARELAEGIWQRVIDDPEARQRAEQVDRLILCSGKVYVDLVTAEQRQQNPSIAIVRVEQLYRFPDEELQAVLTQYPNLQEVIWLQEEPETWGRGRTYRRVCSNSSLDARHCATSVAPRTRAPPRAPRPGSV